MPSPDPHVPLFRRFIAVLGVALLLLLGAASVSPSLHDHLHGHGSDHASPSHVCAVILFGAGIALAATFIATAPRLATRDEVRPRLFAFLPAAPLHRLPPGRGPPAC